MKVLMFMLLSLLFVSCAHKFDVKNQKFMDYKEFSLGSVESELTNKYYQVPYTLGCKDSCFKSCNDFEEIITAGPEDINAILDYIYRSKGTFSITKVTYNHTNKVTVKARDEMKIHYEMAFCKQRRPLLFMFEEVTTFVSYRITKKEVFE